MHTRPLVFPASACAAVLLIGSVTCSGQTLLASVGPATAAAAAAADPTPAPADPSTAPPEDQPAAAPQAAPANDGFRVGDFTFKPGGRVKLDIIRDFKPIGSEDSFDVRTIPIPQAEGTNSNLHAKETRLSLDIRGPVQGKELQMYVETDFYGSSSVLRLRQAYGQWGPLLAGQAWSTFVDPDTMPRTIDFESPMAFASIRQAQLRFTAKAGKSATASFAIEDNKSNITVPANIPGKAEYPLPDFVGRYRFDDGKRHLQLSGFLGEARFRPTDGDTDDVALWGLAASGKLVTVGKDSGYATVTYGDGIGRYRGGTTAVPDTTGKLQAVSGIAVMVGYEHFWSPVYSSNAVFSGANTTDEDFYTSATNKQLNYGAVNFLYWFLGDRGWMGVEYLYGHRQVFGGGDDNATAHRIQYAIRFNLP